MAQSGHEWTEPVDVVMGVKRTSELELHFRF